MEKEFLPGDTVILAGEVSPHLFLIKRGSVKLEGNGETFFLSAEDFFGEEGCFFGKPSLFNVTAGEETLLELMESDEAEKFFAGDPKAAFELFIKNSARTNEKEEPFNEMSRQHIKLIAGILPYVVKKDGSEPVHEAGIDLETLASQIELSKDKLLNLLEFSGRLGYVAFSEEKIFTCGKDKLVSLFKKYNREKIFSGAKGAKGLGTVSFLNIVNKKTNI
ncbi:cyclic nucleotide-binding domain-containing protein [bacterium]|nr:cyclic nucleotide-binding domain-containing protein [bacterium]MBP5590761.1 cyclic nucleotide-binding domain-containing protein [bacterium]